MMSAKPTTKPPRGIQYPRSTLHVRTRDGYALQLPDWVAAGEPHLVWDEVGLALWEYTAGYHGPKFDQIKLVELTAFDEHHIKLLEAGAFSVRQVVELLGIAAPETVDNWLCGGHFNGAYKTASGTWIFGREEVLAAKRFIDAIRMANDFRGLLPPDWVDVMSDCDDGDDPPAL